MHTQQLHVNSVRLHPHSVLTKPWWSPLQTPSLRVASLIYVFMLKFIKQLKNMNNIIKYMINIYYESHVQHSWRNQNFIG